MGELYLFGIQGGSEGPSFAAIAMSASREHSGLQLQAFYVLMAGAKRVRELLVDPEEL